jgi:ribosomal protein S18 acetylase RimI-like enzyme
MIEKMSKDTLEGTIDLHMECFKDSFLTSLDRGALRCMYENYICSELGCAYVYIKSEEVIGFVAGTVNPSIYYNQMLKKRGYRLIWLTLKRVIRDPGIIIPIIRRNYSGFFRPDDSEEAYGKASLDVISVKENYRGTGVAQDLIKAYFSELEKRGIRELHLGVKADNTRAKRFYEKIGLEHIRTHTHPDQGELHIYATKFNNAKQ